MSESADTAATIAAVRRFNRFYTRAIGVLDRGHLGGPYTLAESRVLYEIASADGVTPTEVIAATGLDAGYLSRIVKRFEREGLVAREPSARDGRSVVLRITGPGRTAYAELHRRTIAQVEGLISPLGAREQARLTGALGEVERLLHAPAEPPGCILRPHRLGDIGWVTQAHGLIYGREYGWDHRFEALVARIAADLVENFDPDWEGSWIAERAGTNVGCVFLEKQDETTAKLRLLLVDPAARGLGLGRRLVDACVARARDVGYREITLWTQSVLTAARRIYEAAGFELEESWPNQDFGGLGLISERWRLRL
ncbi:helix-turn-helix domain-containing GNAT family N-acetyltransferase [Phenylobacterium sp.]|uniref:bifunctional helix-turn-helix transcriptional regulator/GNAT family N-acetyltransferase n=1 Tax=Phenylobacterium sp. TaxID=1871053 RepID=UPI002BC1ECB0|nr:helix-turn-helix domain-containing GNAT family N-acetyltransferase [Phenylobacterium sp.]HVI31844.1 helix-turn-helix domain-containing GNAT family N-acetyltransferase [Phenylobacterium sp.]